MFGSILLLRPGTDWGRRSADSQGVRDGHKRIVAVAERKVRVRPSDRIVLAADDFGPRVSAPGRPG